MAWVLSERTRIEQYKGRYYLYHSYWGRPHVVSAEIVSLLHLFQGADSAGDVSKLMALPGLRQAIESLQQAGFLVPDTYDEEEAIRQTLERRSSRIPSGDLLEMLILNLSTACNMRCLYCNVAESHNLRADLHVGQMPFPIARSAIDQFLDIARSGEPRQVALVFFGGEPLLNWHVVCACLEYVSSLSIPGIEVYPSINTNGTLLRPEHAEFLERHGCTVCVSLDGLDEQNDRVRTTHSGQGTFSQIDETLRMLAAFQLPTVVICVLNDLNYQHLSEFVDYLCDKGVAQLILKEALFRTDNHAQFDATGFLPKIEYLVDAISYGGKRGLQVSRYMGHRIASCQGIGSMLSVEPNGDIYPCPGGIPIRLGSVADVRAILSTPQYEAVAMRVAGNIEACRGCAVEGICAGGCAGDAQFLGGDLYSINPEICEYQKRLYLEMVYQSVLQSTAQEALHAV